MSSGPTKLDTRVPTRLPVCSEESEQLETRQEHARESDSNRNSCKPEDGFGQSSAGLASHQGFQTPAVFSPATLICEEPSSERVAKRDVITFASNSSSAGELYDALMDQRISLREIGEYIRKTHKDAKLGVPSRPLNEKHLFEYISAHLKDSRVESAVKKAFALNSKNTDAAMFLALIRVNQDRAAGLLEIEDARTRKAGFARLGMLYASGVRDAEILDALAAASAAERRYDHAVRFGMERQRLGFKDEKGEESSAQRASHDLKVARWARAGGDLATAYDLLNSRGSIHSKDPEIQEEVLSLYGDLSQWDKAIGYTIKRGDYVKAERLIRRAKAISDSGVIRQNEATGVLEFISQKDDARKAKGEEYKKQLDEVTKKRRQLISELDERVKKLEAQVASGEISKHDFKMLPGLQKARAAIEFVKALRGEQYDGSSLSHLEGAVPKKILDDLKSGSLTIKRLGASREITDDIEAQISSGALGGNAYVYAEGLRGMNGLVRYAMIDQKKQAALKMFLPHYPANSYTKPFTLSEVDRDPYDRVTGNSPTDSAFANLQIVKDFQNYKAKNPDGAVKIEEVFADLRRTVHVTEVNSPVGMDGRSYKFVSYDKYSESTIDRPGVRTIEELEGLTDGLERIYDNPEIGEFYVHLTEAGRQRQMQNEGGRARLELGDSISFVEGFDFAGRIRSLEAAAKDPKKVTEAAVRQIANHRAQLMSRAEKIRAHLDDMLKKASNGSVANIAEVVGRIRRLNEDVAGLKDMRVTDRESAVEVLGDLKKITTRFFVYEDELQYDLLTREVGFVEKVERVKKNASQLGDLQLVRERLNRLPMDAIERLSADRVSKIIEARLKRQKGIIESIDLASIARTTDAKIKTLEDQAKEVKKTENVTGTLVNLGHWVAGDKPEEFDSSLQFHVMANNYKAIRAMLESGDPEKIGKAREVSSMLEQSRVSRQLDAIAGFATETNELTIAIGIVIASALTAGLATKLFAPFLAGMRIARYVKFAVNAVTFTGSHRVFEGFAEDGFEGAKRGFGSIGKDKIGFLKESAKNGAMFGALGLAGKGFGMAFNRIIRARAVALLTQRGAAVTQAAVDKEMGRIMEGYVERGNILSLGRAGRYYGLHGSQTVGAFGTELCGFQGFGFGEKVWEDAWDRKFDLGLAADETVLSGTAWKKNFIFLLGLKAGNNLAHPISASILKGVDRAARPIYELRLNKLNDRFVDANFALDAAPANPAVQGRYRNTLEARQRFFDDLMETGDKKVAREAAANRELLKEFEAFEKVSRQVKKNYDAWQRRESEIFGKGNQYGVKITYRQPSIEYGTFSKGSDLVKELSSNPDVVSIEVSPNSRMIAVTMKSPRGERKIQLLADGKVEDASQMKQLAQEHNKKAVGAQSGTPAAIEDSKAPSELQDKGEKQDAQGSAVVNPLGKNAPAEQSPWQRVVDVLRRGVEILVGVRRNPTAAAVAKSPFKLEVKGPNGKRTLIDPSPEDASHVGIADYRAGEIKDIVTAVESGSQVVFAPGFSGGGKSELVIPQLVGHFNSKGLKVRMIDTQDLPDHKVPEIISEKNDVLIIDESVKSDPNLARIIKNHLDSGGKVVLVGGGHGTVDVQLEGMRTNLPSEYGQSSVVSVKPKLLNYKQVYELLFVRDINGNKRKPIEGVSDKVKSQLAKYVYERVPRMFRPMIDAENKVKMALKRGKGVEGAKKAVDEWLEYAKATSFGILGIHFEKTPSVPNNRGGESGGEAGKTKGGVVHNSDGSVSAARRPTRFQMMRSARPLGRRPGHARRPTESSPDIRRRGGPVIAQESPTQQRQAPIELEGLRHDKGREEYTSVIDRGNLDAVGVDYVLDPLRGQGIDVNIIRQSSDGRKIEVRVKARQFDEAVRSGRIAVEDVGDGKKQIIVKAPPIRTTPHDSAEIRMWDMEEDSDVAEKRVYWCAMFEGSADLKAAKDKADEYYRPLRDNGVAVKTYVSDGRILVHIDAESFDAAVKDGRITVVRNAGLSYTDGPQVQRGITKVIINKSADPYGSTEFRISGLDDIGSDIGEKKTYYYEIEGYDGLDAAKKKAVKEEAENLRDQLRKKGVDVKTYERDGNLLVHIDGDAFDRARESGQITIVRDGQITRVIVNGSPDRLAPATPAPPKSPFKVEVVGLDGKRTLIDPLPEDAPHVGIADYRAGETKDIVNAVESGSQVVFVPGFSGTGKSTMVMRGLFNHFNSRGLKVRSTYAHHNDVRDLSNTTDKKVDVLIIDESARRRSEIEVMISDQLKQGGKVILIGGGEGSREAQLAGMKANMPQAYRSAPVVEVAPKLLNFKQVYELLFAEKIEGLSDELKTQIAQYVYRKFPRMLLPLRQVAVEIQLSLNDGEGFEPIKKRLDIYFGIKDFERFGVRLTASKSGSKVADVQKDSAPAQARVGGKPHVHTGVRSGAARRADPRRSGRPPRPLGRLGGNARFPAEPPVDLRRRGGGDRKPVSAQSPSPDRVAPAPSAQVQGSQEWQPSPMAISFANGLLNRLPFGKRLRQRAAQRDPSMADRPMEILNRYLRGELGEEPRLKDVRELEDALVGQDFKITWGIDLAVKGQRVFQIYTAEFLDAMAGYIRDAALQFAAEHGRKPKIVEIAAGDGRLARALNARLREYGLEVKATDKKDVTNEFDLEFPDDVIPMDGVNAAKVGDILVGSWFPHDGTLNDVAIAEELAKQPGKMLILIGDDRGGVTSSQAFWDALPRLQISQTRPDELNYTKNSDDLVISIHSLTPRTAETTQVMVFRGTSPVTPIGAQPQPVTPRQGTSIRHPLFQPSGDVRIRVAKRGQDPTVPSIILTPVNVPGKSSNGATHFVAPNRMDITVKRNPDGSLSHVSGDDRVGAQLLRIYQAEDGRWIVINCSGADSIRVRNVNYERGEWTTLEDGDRIQVGDAAWEFRVRKSQVKTGSLKPSDPITQPPTPQNKGGKRTGLIFGGMEVIGNGELIPQDGSIVKLDSAMKIRFNVSSSQYEMSRDGKEWTPIKVGQKLKVKDKEFVLVELEENTEAPIADSNLAHELRRLGKQIRTQLASYGVEHHMRQLRQERRNVSGMDEYNFSKFFEDSFEKALSSYDSGDTGRTQGGLFGGVSHIYAMVDPISGKIYKFCDDAPKGEPGRTGLRFVVVKTKTGYEWRERKNRVDPKPINIPQGAVVVPLILERMTGRIRVDKHFQSLPLSQQALIRIENMDGLVVNEGGVGVFAVTRFALAVQEKAKSN